MQYILAFNIVAKTKEKQNCYHKHRHIYMHSNILTLQMHNDPHELFYSPTDGNRILCPAKQTPYVKQLSLM